MPIDITEDQDRIEDIKYRHIFNRDPGDEHWRDIDALLASLGHVGHCCYSQEEVDEIERDYEIKIYNIEKDYEKQIDDLKSDHKREMRGYLDHIEELETLAARLHERIKKYEQVNIMLHQKIENLTGTVINLPLNLDAA